MKAVFSLTLTVLFFTFFCGLLHAAEHKTVFKTERLQYKKGTGPKRCQALCDAKSVSDINDLLSGGWKVTDSSPGKLIAERFRYTPCISCEPRECVCIGVEYVLEREKPAPSIKISENELNRLKQENASLREENSALKVEPVSEIKAQTQDSELDILKRENAALRKENKALKLELENIKRRM